MLWCAEGAIYYTYCGMALFRYFTLQSIRSIHWGMGAAKHAAEGRSRALSLPKGQGNRLAHSLLL